MSYIMTPQDSQILLHLSLIDGVGPATVAKLAAWIASESCGWSILYKMSAVDISRTCYLANSMASRIVAGLAQHKVLENELVLIERHGIKWLTIYDEGYPPLLRQIHAPPVILYWKGVSIAYQDTVAVIGSRRANQYGQRVVNTLVPQLISYGATIVSGGALGADTMAHRAAIASGGTTLVILGSGLLRPYPRENQKLFDQISNGYGALMSSYPLQTAPHPGNFPARNRIIAGLSRACIVVQAATQSGASITAQYALDEGRDVYAVPGAIDDELSAGCHALILQGAQLLHTAGELYERDSGRDIGKTEKIPQKIDAAIHGKPVLSVELQALDSQVHLTFSDKIIRLCKTPQSLDDLVANTGYGVDQMHDLLFELQLSGRLVQDFTGMWVVS